MACHDCTGSARLRSIFCSQDWFVGLQRRKADDPHAVLKVEDSLRQAFATHGPRGYWEKLLELSRRPNNPPEAYTTTDGLAILYVRLGDKDKAMQALEQGYTERQLHMTEIGIEPAFDALRPEPRFQDLVRRIGVQR
jgi:hypothetical protein